MHGQQKIASLGRPVIKLGRHYPEEGVMRFGPFYRCFPLAVIALTACGGAEVEVADVSESLEKHSSRANQPPIIEDLRFEPSLAQQGDTVRAVVEISDPDGDPVRATYEWRLNGAPAGGGSPKLVLKDAVRDTSFSLTVIASDGRTESEPASVSGTVANTPAVIDRLLVSPGAELTVGQQIQVDAETRDRDGDEIRLRYAWTLNGAEESKRADGATFSTVGLVPGDVVQVEVHAEDAFSEGESMLSPELRVMNRPPQVVSRPAAAVAGRFRYQIDVTDPDGDTIVYELEDAPDGMQIQPGSGEIAWRPAADQHGQHTVRVVVDDLRGGRIAHDFQLEVAGPPAARAQESY